MYRHLLSKCFENAVFGRQEKVQCNVISDTKQKHVCWKICKLRKVSGIVSGAYYFQCEVS